MWWGDKTPSYRTVWALGGGTSAHSRARKVCGVIWAAKESFRPDVLSRVGAWALSHSDEDPAYDEIFPDYFSQMRDDYYKKQKEVVGKSITRILELLAVDGERLNTEEVSLSKTEEQNAAHALEVLLGEHDGETRRDRRSRETLRETLVYLAKNRY